MLKSHAVKEKRTQQFDFFTPGSRTFPSGPNHLRRRRTEKAEKHLKSETKTNSHLFKKSRQMGLLTASKSVQRETNLEPKTHKLQIKSKAIRRSEHPSCGRRLLLSSRRKFEPEVKKRNGHASSWHFMLVRPLPLKSMLRPSGAVVLAVGT